MAEKMIALPRACAAWGQPDFLPVLARELEALPVHALPLQEGLACSSVVADEAFTAFPRRATADSTTLFVDVQYAGWVAGCNCSDDPGVVESQVEACTLKLDLRVDEGRATVSLLRE